MTRRANFRIPGKEAVAGRVSHSCADPHSHECAYEPGQNGVFSDGFDGMYRSKSGRPSPAAPPVLTKSPVDAYHSGQPGKSTDPKNPMKSKDDPQSKGFPPVPPSFRNTCPSDSASSDYDESQQAATGIPAHLTRKPGPMPRKRKRTSVMEIGNGPARVKIYTVNRKDG
jgi:hypothetical protein